jgi:hypothetical protein
MNFSLPISLASDINRPGKGVMIPVGSERCNTLLATVPRMMVLLLLKQNLFNLHKAYLEFIELIAAPDFVPIFSEREREAQTCELEEFNKTINQSNQYSFTSHCNPTRYWVS